MSNGGMIQLKQDDGTWRDCFPTSYKTHTAAQNVAGKYGTYARVVNRKGRVLYTTEKEGRA